MHDSYENMLRDIGAIDDNDIVLNEPIDWEIVKTRGKKVIVLCSSPRFDKNRFSREIHKVFTPNKLVYDDLKRIGYNTFLLEFSLREKFSKNKQWKERRRGLYYHGRICPIKLPIDELSFIVDKGIEVTLRGPICKEYWTNVDADDPESVRYKNKILDMEKQYYNFNVLESVDRESEIRDEIISTDLNNYKYYFTLSKSESFNSALHESLGTGTIPIVRRNGAYWYANDLINEFTEIGNLIEIYYKLEKTPLRTLEEHSTYLSTKILERTSLDNIKKKYKELSRKEKFKWM